MSSDKILADDENAWSLVALLESISPHLMTMLFTNKVLCGFTTSNVFFLLVVTLSKAPRSIWKVTVEGLSQ